MSKSINNFEYYKEQENLDIEIAKIISNSSEYSSYKKLKKLQKTKKHALSINHIQYYLNKLKQKQYKIIQHVMIAPLIIFYLLYTLNRVYHELNPEAPCFSKIPIISNLTLVEFCMLIPTTILIFYILRYFMAKHAHFNKIIKHSGSILCLSLIFLYSIYALSTMLIFFKTGDLISESNSYSSSFETSAEETYLSSIDYETSQLYDPDTLYWFLDYSYFYSEENNIYVEISYNTEAVIFFRFFDNYNGKYYEWFFDDEPSEIGENGELIYLSTMDFSLIYHPQDHFITIDSSDSLLAGNYYAKTYEDPVE